MWKCEFSLSSDCKPIEGTYEGFITSVSAILQFKQQRMPYFTLKKGLSYSKNVWWRQLHERPPVRPKFSCSGLLPQCTSSCIKSQEGRAWKAHPEPDLTSAHCQGQCQSQPGLCCSGGTDRQSLGRGKRLNSITISTTGCLTDQGPIVFLFHTSVPPSDQRLLWRHSPNWKLLYKK